MPRKADLFAPARARVKELNEKIAAMTAERDAILAGAAQLAGAGPAKTAGWDKKPVTAPPAGKRAPRGSVVEAIVKALEGAAKEGMTVADIVNKMPGSHDSKAISAAISQHLKGMAPRIKTVKKGGRGVPSTYVAV